MAENLCRKMCDRYFVGISPKNEYREKNILDDRKVDELGQEKRHRWRDTSARVPLYPGAERSIPAFNRFSAAFLKTLERLCPTEIAAIQ
jgi:hypothetical protein